MLFNRDVGHNILIAIHFRALNTAGATSAFSTEVEMETIKLPRALT